MGDLLEPVCNLGIRQSRPLTRSPSRYIRGPLVGGQRRHVTFRISLRKCSVSDFPYADDADDAGCRGSSHDRYV